jgi:hypothetical protein
MAAKVVIDNGAFLLVINCEYLTPTYCSNFQQLIDEDSAHDVVDKGIIHAQNLVHSSLNGTLVFPMPGVPVQLWDALRPGTNKSLAVFKDPAIRRSIIKQLFAIYEKLHQRDSGLTFLRFDPRNFVVVVNGQDVQVIYLPEVALLATTLETAPPVEIVGGSTTLYTAPELARRSEDISQQAIDTYALAMITFEEMTENKTFNWLESKYKVPFQQIRAVLAGEVFNLVKGGFPQFAPFFNLIPANRPSFKELVRLKEALDPYFAKTK